MPNVRVAGGDSRTLKYRFYTSLARIIYMYSFICIYIIHKVEKPSAKSSLFSRLWHAQWTVVRTEKNVQQIVCKKIIFEQMDFLSNLIKRPNSIVLPETEPASAPGASPSCSSSAPTAVPSSRHSLSSSTAFITLAMDRCSIDPELDSLFDSAAQDLDSLERQHKDLIDHVDAPVPCPDSPPKSTNSTREAIKQLLSEINFNLDQVTAREMEHLQAMSLEVGVDCEWMADVDCEWVLSGL